MKDVDEIRRENLIAEAARLGGDGKLAAAIRKNKNQVYQWLRAPMRPKAPSKAQRRNISKTIARDIEPLLGRDRGWLDTDHAAELTGVKEPAPEYISPAHRQQNDVLALRFALQGFATLLHNREPKLAEEAAREILAVAGLSFCTQGFANVLLGFLVGAERTSKAGLRELLRPPVSSESRRGSVRVK